MTGPPPNASCWGHQILICLPAKQGPVSWSFQIPGKDRCFLGHDRGPAHTAPCRVCLPTRRGLVSRSSGILGQDCYFGTQQEPPPAHCPCHRAPNFGLLASLARARSDEILSAPWQAFGPPTQIAVHVLQSPDESVNLATSGKQISLQPKIKPSTAEMPSMTQRRTVTARSDNLGTSWSEKSPG